MTLCRLRRFNREQRAAAVARSSRGPQNSGLSLVHLLTKSTGAGAHTYSEWLPGTPHPPML